MSQAGDGATHTGAEMAESFEDSLQNTEEDYIFNEYAIDDTLNPLQRLLRYHLSDFSLQRLVLVRELHDTARFAGYAESVKSIVPLLTQLASDSEPVVRQSLIQELFPLAQFFIEEGGDSGYERLLSTFLPIGFELLVDKNIEVGLTALEAIKELANLVHPEHVQAHLLNFVIALAHDERAEDYRVVAAQLFNDFAAKFGAEVCMTIVLPELELLSNDSSFSVRKTVGGNLGEVCRVMTDPQAQQTVLALYFGLCTDDIWGVREACAGSVESIALGLPPDVRVNQLVPVFLHLLEDNSRWVRHRAHEIFGRLIHALRREDISPALLQTYTNMAFQTESGDCELSEICAFFFPAVVQAVGPGRWLELRDAYATMLKDVQWKVRKSLAYSLHELAEILGTELTEDSIVPAFELLLRDLDDIKLGIILNVHRFLRVVTPATLDRLVPLLCHVPLESENWRLRNVVAKCIGEVGLLMSPSSPSFPPVLALVMRLLHDSVMEVRASTYRPAAVILKHLASANQADQGGYLKTIVELADRPSFQGRQMFVYVTQQAVEVGADDVVEQHLIDGLQRLANDRVNNVRLVVDKVVHTSFLTNPRWRDHPKVANILRTLQAWQKEEANQPVVNEAAEEAALPANRQAAARAAANTAVAEAPQPPRDAMEQPLATPAATAAPAAAPPPAVGS